MSFAESTPGFTDATERTLGGSQAETTTDHDSQTVESFSYDDRIVRMFLGATILWGIFGTLAGLLLAILMVVPNLFERLFPGFLDFEFAQLFSFGRLRPVHTNAAIFAFAGNAIFAAVYYSTQRLCKCRMWSGVLSQLHFWGWQAIIIALAATIPWGITQGKEYAESEWPIDIAIAVVWSIFFGANFFMTLYKRRERHMYVSLWFYIATIVTVTILHVFNNIVVPIGPWKSYSVYAGVQDALMQWFYGHNAIAFLLTTPFLGLMYYFLPKAAERPVFSYKLSIIQFWSLIFIYVWAGPHHLHYTALPEWASTLGMLFGVMLWIPLWGGMINGLLTLRGAWHRVTVDPVLKFFVVGITFYGISTFDGPLLSIKSVNALSHYTDWTIAHVHSGALGWNGFMTFGMIYWLMPRLFQTKLWSQKLAECHFWLGTIGILFYVVPIYIAGITQGLMWSAMDDLGQLKYPDFVETIRAIVPYWWIRVLGGALYATGVLMLAMNALLTWLARPARYDVPVVTAPRLSKIYIEKPLPPSSLEGAPVVRIATAIDAITKSDWHRRWERWPIRFTALTITMVVIASLFELVPMFLIRGNIPRIPSVKPYTPLELAGRDIYVSEGCHNCHSQMIRPLVAETTRYLAKYSLAGEFIYDHPFQWGSRRIGPDLAREGGKNNSYWHWRHLEAPSQLNKHSVMPQFKHLLSERLNFKEIPKRVWAAQKLGADYDMDLAVIEEGARKQAQRIAAEIISQGGPIKYEDGLIEDKTAIALIAYLQRLGKDISAPPPTATPATSTDVDSPLSSESRLAQSKSNKD